MSWLVKWRRMPSVLYFMLWQTHWRSLSWYHYRFEVPSALALCLMGLMELILCLEIWNSFYLSFVFVFDEFDKRLIWFIFIDLPGNRSLPFTLTFCFDGLDEGLVLVIWDLYFSLSWFCVLVDLLQLVACHWDESTFGFMFYAFLNLLKTLSIRYVVYILFYPSSVPCWIWWRSYIELSFGLVR